MLKEHLKDFSIIENLSKDYEIPMEDIEKCVKHYEYHIKSKVNDDSVRNFLSFFFSTHSIISKEREEFIRELYERECRHFKIFKGNKVNDILQVFDCDKAFENLYYEYYVSLYELDNGKSELLYTPKEPYPALTSN